MYTAIYTDNEGKPFTEGVYVLLCDIQNPKLSSVAKRSSWKVSPFRKGDVFVARTTMYGALLLKQAKDRNPNRAEVIAREGDDDEVLCALTPALQRKEASTLLEVAGFGTERLTQDTLVRMVEILMEDGRLTPAHVKEALDKADKA